MTCKSCTEKDIVISKLHNRIEALEKLLNVYHNPHTPPSKKQFPSKKPKSNGKPGQKEGHAGVTRPIAEPDETISVTAESCPECGKSLDDPIGFESRIIEEIPEPQPIKVIEFLLGHYICGGCNKEVVAAHPDCPSEGRFGKKFTSLVTVMKYLDRLPYRKISKALKRQYVVELSGATILDLTRRAADAMRPEYVEIMKRIRRAKVVYGDETGIKVNGRKCWIWVFVSGKDVIVVVADSRGKDVIEKTLGKGFRGTIVCDGWKPYTSFTKRIQRCWAHLLREADALAEHHREGMWISNELHSMFDDCEEALGNDPPPRARKRLWKIMKARMKEILDRRYRSKEVRKFISKISNGSDYWLTFILHPYVEPTNNIAERALRENVIIRNIIKTLRNEKGMYLHETAMSVLTTWDNMGLNPYEELARIL